MKAWFIFTKDVFFLLIHSWYDFFSPLSCFFSRFCGWLLSLHLFVLCSCQPHPHLQLVQWMMNILVLLMLSVSGYFFIFQKITQCPKHTKNYKTLTRNEFTRPFWQQSTEKILFSVTVKTNNCECVQSKNWKNTKWLFAHALKMRMGFHGWQTSLQDCTMLTFCNIPQGWCWRIKATLTAVITGYTSLPTNYSAIFWLVCCCKQEQRRFRAVTRGSLWESTQK